MKATITTTAGAITWESTGGDREDADSLVEGWTRWAAGDNPRFFAHVVHDDGAFNIRYCDIVSIDIDGERVAR